MKKMMLFILVLFMFLPALHSKTKNYHFYIHPQYTNVKEHLGVYFGYNENSQTVSDKYSLDESLDIFSLEYSFRYKTRFMLKGYYSDTEGFKLGSSDKDFKKNWFDLNYKLGLGKVFDIFAYYSRYEKNLNIPDEITFDVLNVKYLAGIGVTSYGLAGMKFSDLSESGGHGIIYCGAGEYENNVWMLATNPSNPEVRDLTFVAKEDLGFVFFMDMGALYNSGRFYIGAKMKVGGFFSGEVIVNEVDKTDQVISGTIEMEAVGGINITKNLQIGLDWKMNDENNRNESEMKDGSRFTNYVTNVFLNISFSF
jgi:hypothetical protein